MNFLAVIPCRYASTRLPGKPLLKIKEKTIIEHVFEGVASSKKLTKIIIATDDDRIFQVAKQFGAEAMMTSPKHATGTDRVAEVLVKQKKHFDVVLNIQGDEPLVDEQCIDALIKPFLEKKNAVMSTLCAPIRKKDDLENPNVVKLVKDKNHKALYFSRFSLPYSNKDNNGGKIARLKHIGLYGFKSDFLLKYQSWPQSPLEKVESLEQLRALENGYPIYVETVDKEMIDVNTSEDLLKVSRYYSLI